MSPAKHGGMTVNDGFAVARGCVDEVAGLLGENLMAAYRLGSLAHGGFAPAVSDVDVCFVVRDAATAGPELSALMMRARAEAHPLRQRLSLFWTGEEALRQGRPDGRLPAVDHADLVVHGALERGQDVLSGLVPPDRGELVASTAEFVIDKWAQDKAWMASLHRPESLVSQGPRSVTKTVLFPVRFLWTVATGLFGQVVNAVDWYLSWDHSTTGGRALAHAALGWRETGQLDQSAPELLGKGLVPLWLQLFEELPSDPRITSLAKDVTAAR